MTVLATGKGSRGEYRLTAAHRFFVALLGAVVVVTTALSGPATVNAAAVWVSEVRFGGEETTEVPTVRWTLDGSCTNSYRQYPDSTPTTLAPMRADSATARITQTVSGGCVMSGGTGGSRYPAFGYSTTGTWQHTSGSPGVGDALTEAQDVRIALTGSGTSNCAVGAFAYRYGNWSGQLATTTLVPNMSEPASFALSVDWTLPVGTRIFVLTIAQWCTFSAIQVSDIETVEGTEGDCIGQAGPGADGQLVFDSGAITSPTGATGWGHQWFSTEGGSCRFTESEVYHFNPWGGFTPGDTHRFGIQAWLFNTPQTARVTISWARNGGGPEGSSTSALNWTSTSTEAVGTGGAYFTALDVPAQGADYLIISIGHETALAGLYIANVEGDETLDLGEYPSTDYGGTIPDPIVDYFEDCVPGSDFLAVGEWVAYAACLIEGGFAATVDWLRTLRDDFVAVWDDFVFPGFVDIGGGIGSAFSWLLSELLATIFAPFHAGLELLFAPSDDVLDRWEAVSGIAETRFPFSAAASVFDGVEAGLAAPASGVIGSLDGLEVVGQPLALGSMVNGAIATVAPWRGFLFAGVVLLFIPRFIGVVFAAVGVTHVQPKGDGE